ncbi:DNA-3-methyladenine glycosylase [Pullulanibacillus sp. KACC 23026]|uniref:DNA-3-methyladenine glycosylase family protein n=1 Tax=Pullulanibacillus sp. KACC 23026 TaxID=3028315 RepID=UPI0023AED171|nr:DNA-3-methyladenine glycosylase [Pullulanibacillus sp. KACC 23026]WEG12861.1 DNA-3-methyladenine glycosylase [Pullulanibacillus sp. KACC 23026]
MNWMDCESSIEIFPPKEFNFEECLVFLGRSNQEVLHQIKEGSVYKLIKVDDTLILCKIGASLNSMKVEFPISIPSSHARQKVAEYIWEWFDLDQELGEFYRLAGQDKILETLVYKYYGLRIMCIPDLFEALVWAIMGQQINLTFAYTLKKRFVEQYGESLTFEGETFWLFPSFEKIASINVDDLRKLQFTNRKAEYIIGIAKAMAGGGLTKDLLLQMKDYQQIQKSLMMVRGVGAWTADYVMMKCLHITASFPIADVGLHNALKNLLGLERKPSIEEIKEYALNWRGWQSYATFYLWRSLHDKNV